MGQLFGLNWVKLFWADRALRAQFDIAPEAPISKSADYLKILSPTGFNGRQVWKPARPQTGKSAVLGFRPVATRGSAEHRRAVQNGCFSVHITWRWHYTCNL